MPKAHSVYIRGKKIIIASYVPVISSNVRYAELSKQNSRAVHSEFNYASLFIGNSLKILICTSYEITIIFLYTLSS